MMIGSISNRFGAGAAWLVGLALTVSAASATTPPHMVPVWGLSKSAWTGACKGKLSNLMTASSVECANVSSQQEWIGDCGTGYYDADHYVSDKPFTGSVKVYRLTLKATCGGCKPSWIWTADPAWKATLEGQGWYVQASFYAWPPTADKSWYQYNGLTTVYHLYSSTNCDNFYSEHATHAMLMDSSYGKGQINEPYITDPQGAAGGPWSVAYAASNGYLEIKVQCLGAPNCPWTLTGPGGFTGPDGQGGAGAWSVSKTGNWTGTKLPTHGYRLDCHDMPGLVNKYPSQFEYFPMFSKQIMTCLYKDKCVSECTYAGQTQCVGDGVATCTESPTGCLTWSAVQSCNDYKACTVDTCVGAGQCAHQTLDCTGLDGPCTKGVCGSSGCETQYKNGAPCDDGQACTQNDHCSNGSCVGGTGLDCSYLNTACQVGQCLGGSCTSVDKSGGCEDGDLCTVGDYCAKGVCQAGVEKDCSAMTGQCTKGVCQAGACHPVNTFGSCTDFDACTTGDVCMNGTCVGQEMDCTGWGDACNAGYCLGGVCKKKPAPGPCNDGKPCTVNDTCQYGTCQGTPMVCGGDACNIGICVGGSCSKAPKVGPCTPDDPCDLGGQCVGGVCQGTPKDCSAFSDACNTGVCDGGTCTQFPKVGACQDGDPCTVGDVCVGGVCQGDPMDCSAAADACNAAVCVAGTCAPAPKIDGLACDDNNSCTEGDTCQGGVCTGTPKLDCNDGNPCTNDSCINGACVFIPNFAACDDLNPCTIGEQCADGACTGAKLNPCDDDNACTADSCLEGVGCKHQNLSGTPCEDGDLCTTPDQCAEGLCMAGAPKSCGDDNPCTDDTCAPNKGCQYANNTKPCEDGDGCTVQDGCENGQCAAGPSKACDDNNVCTTDSCQAGACVFVPNSLPCDDSAVCTTQDVCSGGVCAGVATGCDDGNPCTTDTCQAGVGCVHAFNSEPCNDYNACTIEDYCAGGVCVSGLNDDCNDNEPCTIETCVPTVGCIYEDIGGPCDDGDSCTQGEVCEDGKCTPTVTIPCDDNNPCTVSVCGKDSGCSHTPDNSLSCDDGDQCTTSDSCVDGACTAGLKLSCDDLNPCTDDACVPALGCIHENNAAPCDDASVCTVGDICNGGACVSGAPKVCNDNDPCTLDVCDALDGCGTKPLSECPAEMACGTFCGIDCGACLLKQVCLDDHQCHDTCTDPKMQDCLSGGTVLGYCDVSTMTIQVQDCAEKGEVCAKSALINGNTCCSPDCGDAECGAPDDLCQASCGECSEGQSCVDYHCTTCTCADKQCGVDECGQPCPSQCALSKGEICVGHQCVSECAQVGVTEAGQCQSDTVWVHCVGGQVEEKSCLEDGQRCNAEGAVGCISCAGDCAANGWACGWDVCGNRCGDNDGVCGLGQHCSFNEIGNCQTSGDCRCVCDSPPCQEEATVDESAAAEGGDWPSDTAGGHGFVVGGFDVGMGAAPPDDSGCGVGGNRPPRGVGLLMWLGVLFALLVYRRRHRRASFGALPGAAWVGDRAADRRRITGRDESLEGSIRGRAQHVE